MDGGAWGGCSPWGRLESDTTEQLHFHFSLSCIGEGNGNPLQCSCLENSRDRGAWWAAVLRVTQSRTRLKRLGSSSSSSLKPTITSNPRGRSHLPELHQPGPTETLLYHVLSIFRAQLQKKASLRPFATDWHFKNFVSEAMQSLPSITNFEKKFTSPNIYLITPFSSWSGLFSYFIYFL